MKKIIYALVLIYLLSILDCLAQNKVVVDLASNLPISDVSIFISNTSIGTVTNISGAYHLIVEDQENQYLIISHVNYNNRKILINNNYSKTDTIRLELYEEPLTEVSIKFKENTALRKRRLRRFISAFLGEPKYKKKVRITNADKLLLYEKDGALMAQISEPINVVNDYLGYEIDFHLEQFKLLRNDDLFIKGNAYFREINSVKVKLSKTKRNRNKLFQQSSGMFFHDLTRNELSDKKYKIGTSTLDRKNAFTEIMPIHLDSLQIERGGDDNYTLFFNGLLTVGLLNVSVYGKNLRAEKGPVSLGIRAADGYDHAVPTSYFKSKSNTIVLNSDGGILNPLDIEEYGYWSRQRIASMLPSNFSVGESSH